jgi:hypothetical protein
VTQLVEKPSFFQRIFTKAGAEATAIIQKYEGVRGQVEAIGDKLDTHRTKLMEDVERLERPLHRHARLVPCAGRPHRRRRARAGPDRRRAHPAMVAAAERGDSPIAAQNLRDARAGARRAGPPRTRPAPDPAGGDAGACPRCG